MPDNLQLRFWQLAVKQTEGFGIEPGCEVHLRQFIRDGVERITREGAADNEDKIHLAEANLSLFISEMTNEAMRQGFTSLHEPTYFAVRGWMCPLWPFC